MADKPDHDQQTEAPTAKRRADAARDGDILQSRELGTAIMMIVVAGWIMIAGQWFVSACAALIKDALTLSIAEIRSADPATQIMRLGTQMMVPLFSLLGLTVAAALGGSAVLGSLGFRPGAAAFKGSRINPAAGIARMFGSHGLIELAKALVKAGTLGAVGWWLVMDALPLMMGLGTTDIGSAAAQMGKVISFAVLAMALALAGVAGIDVPMQIIRRMGRLRMTKQQVKEEMRQSEGAPELKQAQRQRQQDLLMGSARKAVTDATVVLTNPTHFAVALRYRPGRDAAPVVVARGRGETALAIRALAKEQYVPTLEYPQLARALYFTTRAGHGIAEDLYIAVATVLAFVFNIERALADGAMQPTVDVPTARQFDEHGKKIFSD
jgi:flagellar biosynthesis protein FlhB